MPNTISTKTYRDKYRSTVIDNELRRRLIAEAICNVDRSDSKTIQNPYGSTPTAVVQAIAGTYTPATFTTTDDTLTVADEVIVAEHIFDFENVLTTLNLFNSRTEQMAFSVKNALDKFVLNTMLEDGTGTYTTPVGGFSAANVITIFSELTAKFAGYEQAYRGLYLVVEHTDLPGIIAAQALNGYSIADSALKNGFMGHYMGFDIYVTRGGTFVDETTSTVSGTKTWTNLNHRLAGVKGLVTYAAPRGVRFQEKEVTGKTGSEVVYFGYVGVKVWAPTATLTVDITLA